jgi:hypothetical protein
MSQLPRKLSTPEGFHSRFGDMVGGEPQISDAILNHLQNNMGLNVDAVSMDDLIQVVQEQVDQLASQTEALLSKFRRTQSGLQQAADTLNQVGTGAGAMQGAAMDMAPEGPMPPAGGDMGMPPEGPMPPPEGPPPAPEEPPPEGPPPAPEEPPPEGGAPPPEMPPPEEGQALSDENLKEGPPEEILAEDDEMSDDDYDGLLKYMELVNYLIKSYGDAAKPPVEEAALEEAAPPEEASVDPENMFDGENLSQLMAGISNRF